MDFRNAAAQSGAVLHLGEHVSQKHHLAIAGASNQRILRIPSVLDHKARVFHLALAAHPLQIALPALAVGRVGQHEVKLTSREGVVGQGRMLRPTNDIVGGFSLAFQQQVGFGDGVGLGVNLLPVEVGRNLLVVGFSQLLEGLFCDGQHSARAAGSVVE